MDVLIEPVEHSGRPQWQVRLGVRGITFDEELAARQFAAQLRQRKLWLQERASTEEPSELQPH